MATTLDTFETMMRRRAGSPDDTTRMTDAIIMELVIEGLREIARRTGYKGKTSGSVNSTSGTSSYSCPAAIVTLNALYWNDPEGLIKPTNEEELDRRDGNWRKADSAAVPVWWFPNGMDSFTIYPAPNATTTTAMTAYGNAKPTEPSAGESSLDIPDRCMRVLLAYCLWQWFESESDHDRSGQLAGKWLAQYERAVEQMAEDVKTQHPEVRRVLDTDYDWEEDI